MNAPTVEELTRFIRFLGHERFAIKSVKTGEKGAQEAHFDLINANRAVDYIKLRNGKWQLWVNVQRLKRKPQKFHTHLDVEAYTNIFIDVDAKKPDDKKDFAATERERGFALAQLPTVQGWLSTKGLKPGLGFKSGNGGGLLLPIPPAEPTPEFIAKVAAFLKVVRKEADVDIDTATFDPPRVCGILGTWNSKFEDEAEGRKNHLREVIGEIPQRDEDEKLLEFIEGLTPDPDALKTWAEKFNQPPATEEAEPEPPEDAGEIDVDFVREKLDALLEADPVLLDLLNWTEAAQERLKRNRSDAEFGAVGKLTAAGFTDPEINWIMTYISRIGKWSEEGEHYQRLTLRKIRANDAKEAAEAVRVEGGGYVADLPSGEKLRVSCKKENWFVEVSGGAFKPVQISDKPIWFDNRKWEKLPEKLGVDPGLWDQIRDDVRKLEGRRQADEKAREEEAGERLKIAPDVEREADQILSAGLAFEYLYETWQARHLGDAKVGKALLGGFGAQRCVSTSGIHIQINGPREAGKSHAVEEAVNLLPPRLVMMGSMSNMTLYYVAEDMPAGAAVSIDDITYTETFGAVQKRCTTGFQSGATHRSVVDSKDGKVVKKFTTKPRMAFYTTCVDRQQDEQLRSRLWSIDADSSPEHKQAVIDFRKKKDAGLLFDPAEEERKTAVCRAIFEDLDSRLFDVVIPFAERLITSPGLDVRSYNIISDLTKSLAVYRYRVREKDDRGRVLATEKDFFDAKAIFDATEGHSDIKFTEAELRVLEALTDLGFKASMSDLCRKTGLSKSRVDEILNGRGKGEQKRHGLMSKAPITREQESDSWTYDRDPDTGDFRRKTVTQFIYYLDPSFRLQGYKSLIKLETDNGGEVSGAFRRVSGGVSVDDNDNGKEVSGVSVEKTEEEVDNVLPLRGAVGRDGEDISSNTCPGKTTETTESPSPLAVRTTETSPETTEKVRKPPEQKGDGDGVHGVHGGGRPLTLTLNEKKREGEREEREKREGKDRKSPPPSPPQPQDDGFGGVHGVHGGDTEAVAGEIPEPSDDYQSIAERTATPPPKPKCDEGRAPTSEEAGVLEDVARRILQNWPGIAEARLWELAREKLGSPLPLAVVKAWLKESGYTEAGRLNGSPLWNPPAAGEVVG